MTPAEALDAVVARTGHERFRQLLDPSHPDHNPAYWPVVLRMAGVDVPEPAPAPAAATSAPAVRFAVTSHPAPAWLEQVNTCLWRTCRRGCQRSKCWAGYGDRWHGDPWGEVSLHQCRACQAGTPPGPS